jgi:hypothetical protein
MDVQRPQSLVTFFRLSALENVIPWEPGLGVLGLSALSHDVDELGSLASAEWMVVVRGFEGSSGGVAHMVLVVSAHLLEKMAQMLLSVLLRYCEVEQNLVVEVDIG